jgi:nicotinamide phosphoribosyltransferase
VKGVIEMFRIPLIKRTDAYKITHHLQYPKKTQVIYSYLEARGGAFDSTTFYGLQIYVDDYLKGEVVTHKDIESVSPFFKKVFNQPYFNECGWNYIVDEHKGRLPIEIKAVPEGSVVPNRNVLMTVENTDPNVPWVTNYLESLLLKVWYTSGVATLSREIKKMIDSYAVMAGERVSPFHLNDFGYRGASSEESAALGGSAHLVNFLGTDNLVGVEYATHFYDTDVCGFSVMAAEHSTITSYGRDGEVLAYKTIIGRTPFEAVVSIVCDSYDAINAVDKIFGVMLKDQILARQGKTVIRPDSGDPVQMSSKILDILWSRYGGTINDKGYKVLDPHVGVIYGDYISHEMIDKILREVVVNRKYAPSNIIFGMGGRLLQGITRDTLGMSFKCSCAEIDGVWRDVYKEPKTDAFKISKRGKLRLSRNAMCGFETFPKDSGNQDELVTVFKNGEVIKRWNFDEIRKRAEIPS